MNSVKSSNEYDSISRDFINSESESIFIDEDEYVLECTESDSNLEITSES